MASLVTHLVVAEEWLKNNKNEITNKKEFIDGVLSVDLCEDKNKSHYSGTLNIFDFPNTLKEKVHLEKFVQSNKIDSNYNKGVFFHLITDWEFYNNLFLSSQLSNKTFKEWINSVYHDYPIITKILNQEFNYNFKTILEEKFLEESNEYLQIFENKQILDFVKDMSLINLNQKYSSILNQNRTKK